MIHDIEPKHLYNEWKPNAVPKRSSAVVQFCGRNLLCRIDDNGLKLPSRAMFPDGVSQGLKRLLTLAELPKRFAIITIRFHI